MVDILISISPSLIFIAIGIITFLLKRPANFWANFKSIKPKDYKAYNRRVGLLWITLGIYTMINLLIISIFDHKLTILAPLLGLPIGVIIFIVFYSKIESDFKNR